MKKILFLTTLTICLSVATAQQKMDNIPESVNIEIAAKLAVYGNKLAELRTWMQKRNGEQAKTTAYNHVLFRWPMRANSNYDDIPNYDVVSNYMDINRDNNYAPDDWYCSSNATISYDGHEGNDYSLYPFFWRMKENDNVFACAGADGVVVGVRDSTTNDNNCMRDSLENNSANYIAILHADSSMSRYLHIKTGSARVKEGQFVKEGQLLAKIASSGHSSNPHLHFDLRYFRDTDGSWNFVEPFDKYWSDTTYGSGCNPFTNTSWWKNQRTYIDPRLNRVMTHSGSPVLAGWVNQTLNSQPCPESEDAKAKNQFAPDEYVTIGAALTHANYRDSVHITILYPNGGVWVSFPMPVPNNGYAFYSAIYLTRLYHLPAAAPEGTYTIIADYFYRPFYQSSPFSPQTTLVSKTYRHYFTVGCPATRSLAGSSSGDQGYIVSNDLNSSVQISAGTVLYQSANYIQLTPGFVAQQGALLKARIRDCNFSD